MAAPEAGNTRYLLIFLDQRIGLPDDVRDRDLHLNLALGGAFLGRVFGLSGAHNCLSKAAATAESEGKFSLAPYAATLSVKTLEEQRQTAEGLFLPTKVTGEAFVWTGWLCDADTLVREKHAAKYNSRGPQSLRDTKSRSNCKSSRKISRNGRGRGVRATQATTMKANACPQLAQGSECGSYQLHDQR